MLVLSNLLPLLWVEVFGIGAATEAVIQPSVYNYKQEINSPYELQDALFNIAAGGLGNALLSGAGHSLAAGFKRISGKLENTAENRKMAEAFAELQKLQTFTDDAGPITEAQLEVRLTALNKVTDDFDNGRKVDLAEIEKFIDTSDLKVLNDGVKNSKAEVDYIVKAIEDIKIDEDLLKRQQKLEASVSTKMSRTEKKQPQAMPSGSGIKLDAKVDVDKLTADQKIEWNKTQAKLKLESQGKTKAAEAELKESRKQGDMVKAKAERESLEASLAEASADYKKATDDLGTYMDEKKAATQRQIGVAATDTQRVKSVKDAASRIVHSLGGGRLKVNVYEGDFKDLIANPEKLRFSKAEDIDFKAVDPDSLVDDIPYIEDFSFLEGKTVRPTFADLTDAGTVYTGIDSSQVAGRSLQGGPDFPFLNGSQGADIVWAVQGNAVPTRMKGSDYVVVLGMSESAHQSNSTVY